MSHRRESVQGQRFDRSILEELTKAEKEKKLPETVVVEKKLPETVVVERKLPETAKVERKPSESSKREEKETKEEKETSRTTITYMPTLKHPLSSVSSEERINRSLSSTRRNSLPSLKLQLAVQVITVHLQLDASVLGMPLAVQQRVDLNEPSCPWNATRELITSLNRLRQARHMQELDTAETCEIHHGFCHALLKAMEAVQGQVEEMGSPALDLFSRLRGEGMELSVSCFLPGHLFNDDPNSDFGMQVRFPVSMEGSLSESARATSEEMAAAVEEVRKKSALGDLNPETKEWLKEEIQWLLEMKVRRMWRT